MDEFHLKRMYRSPNVRLRNILGGTIFREPIIRRNVPRLVPNWTQPIVNGRHAYGDQYAATDFRRPGSRNFDNDVHPVGRRRADHPQGLRIPGRQRRNGDLQPRRFDLWLFARSSFNFALQRGWPLYLSTKDTILKQYDGRFRDLFQEVYGNEFVAEFKKRNLTYEHRMIDDMVALALKWNGGFVWACKNYDGDVQSNTLAQGFGSLGMMTPDGKTVETEAAHGTVTLHYRHHQQGRETSTNPIASIFAWTRGLRYGGTFDGTPEVVRFAENLEKVCIDTVEGGDMTRDLAILIRADHPWLTTNQFLDKLYSNLQRAMAS